MGSRDCYGLLRSLPSIYVIFGPVDIFSMVAEGPDHHGGGPGRVRDGENGPNGSHITVHGDGGYTLFLYVIYGAVRRVALVHL